MFLLYSNTIGVMLLFMLPKVDYDSHNLSFFVPIFIRLLRRHVRNIRELEAFLATGVSKYQTLICWEECIWHKLM